MTNQPPPPAPESGDSSKSMMGRMNDFTEKRAGAGGSDSWAIAEDGRNGSVTFSEHGLDRELKKTLGKNDRQTIHYRGIVGVEHDRKRMGRDIVTVRTSSDSFEWKVVADAEGFVDRLNAVIANGGMAAAAPTPPPAAAAPAGGDLASKIAELAALRDQGILDDAEFAAAKAKLISG